MQVTCGYCESLHSVESAILIRRKRLKLRSTFHRIGYRVTQWSKPLIQITLQERVSERNGEQIIDTPIPQLQEKLVGMIQLILQERISERIGATLALRIQETLFEVIQLIRQEPIQEHIVEETMQVPISRVMKETVEAVKHVPQERVQRNTVERIVAVPLPQFPEEKTSDPAYSARPNLRSCRGANRYCRRPGDSGTNRRRSEGHPSRAYMSP